MAVWATSTLGCKRCISVFSLCQTRQIILQTCRNSLQGEELFCPPDFLFFIFFNANSFSSPSFYSRLCMSFWSVLHGSLKTILLSRSSEFKNQMILKKQRVRAEFSPVSTFSAHSDQRPPRMASSTIEHFSQECMRLSWAQKDPSEVCD